MFIAQLAFNPQPDRGAVALGQWFAIQAISQNSLRVKSIDQINAFIMKPTR